MCERLSDFCCGENYNSSDFYRNNTNNSQLQLYYDFECTNPLGSSKTVHKIGAIYFSVRNLPAKCLSKINFIYLVSLFNTNDIKGNSSYNDVMKPIFDDLKFLEDTGLSVVHNNSEIFGIFGWI